VKFRRLALGAGLVLLLWLAQRIGLGVIARCLRQVGWGFAAVLALEGLVVLLTTLGWRRTLAGERRVPFRSLIAMRIAGDGVNALAPAAVVGGELVKAGLLSRYVPGPEALGSVGVAAMCQFLAQVLFVGLGATFARTGALEPRLRVLGPCLLAFLAVFLVFLSWAFGRRGAAARLLARLMAWAGRRRAGKTIGAEFASDLAAHVAASVRERPGRLASSALLFLGGWLVSCAEAALVMALLGAPVSIGTAFSIAVLAVLVEGVFFFVPARVGIQEGGLYAIFLALGLDPVLGFTFGLVRRLRELSWGLAGLAILAFLRKRSPEAAAEISAVRAETPLEERASAS
jgi:glycosyltransferase 2 family protein